MGARLRSALKRLLACVLPAPEEPDFFRRGVVYPSEVVNGRSTPYVEIWAVVASVNAFAPKDPLEDVRVRMNVPGHGEVIAYARGGLRVRGGDRVLVHVYEAGGGWYPDNRVVAVEHRERTPTSYNPRLHGAAAEAARQDPNKPEGACCNAMERDFAGGCVNCGDPCL